MIYLSASAEKESGFRIAITGFAYLQAEKRFLESFRRFMRQGKDIKIRLPERIGGKEYSKHLLKNAKNHPMG